MGMITKNGQLHPIPTRKGRQKGLVTKNGQIVHLPLHKTGQTTVTKGPKN